MNMFLNELGQPESRRMTRTMPFPMFNITTGEDDLGSYPVAPPDPDPRENWPNEIFVFKVRDAPGRRVTTPCTRDSCSCNHETVANLVQTFCEGLHTIIQSRSKMCLHTVANELMGEENRVFFTMLEYDSDGNRIDYQTERSNSNPTQGNGTINQPSSNPRSNDESLSPPTTCSSDGSTIGLASSGQHQDRDPRIQIEFWINPDIYEELPDDDDAVCNEGNGRGTDPPDEIPPQALAEAIESTSQMNQFNEQTDHESTESNSRTAINSSSELDNPTSNATPNANPERRRPSIAEKEVPELEGDAGIFCSSNSKRSNIFRKRLNVTDTLASSQADRIIVEDLPVPVAIDNPLSDHSHCEAAAGPDKDGSSSPQNSTHAITTGSNQPHSSLESNPNPELSGGDMVAESGTIDKKSKRARKNWTGSKQNRVIRRYDITDINTLLREREAQMQGELESMDISITEGNVTKRSAAPASVKFQRFKKFAKQVTANSVPPVLQQSNNNESDDSPLKRIRQNENIEEAAPVPSSSAEISLATKRPRLLESDDEYDADQDSASASKDAEMEVGDGTDSEKGKISQLGNTADDPVSVTTEGVPEAEKLNLIVDYDCSPSESVVSVDDLPLNRRLTGKRSSHVEVGQSIEHIDDADVTNHLSKAMQKKSQGKSEDKVLREFQREKDKIAAQFNRKNRSDDMDEDIMIVEEIQMSNAKDKETVGIKTKAALISIPIHIKFPNPPRKTISVPVESQTAWNSDLDKPTSNTSSNERAPLLRSASSPAAPETEKEIALGDETMENRTPREIGETIHNNIDLLAETVPRISRIEVDRTAAASTTKAKRPPAPPPPIISKASTSQRYTDRINAMIDHEKRKAQNSNQSLTQPFNSSQPTSTSPSSSDCTDDVVNIGRRQQTSLSGNNYTSTENNTSPLRSPRQQIFDPRNTAMKITQKPVPKVTKDTVTESLLKKNNLPLPTATVTPTPSMSYKPGPRTFMPPVLQRKSTLGKRPMILDGGEVRMAPKQTTTTARNPVPGFRDRNLNEPRKEPANQSNSEADFNGSGNSLAGVSPLEESRKTGLGRGIGRSAEGNYRRFGGSHENDGGQSSFNLNDNTSTLPEPTVPLDPRLRNISRSSMEKDQNSDGRKSPKPNENENMLRDPRLRNNPSSYIEIPENIDIVGWSSQTSNESELRDPRRRNSSRSSSQENHARSDGRTPRPNENENEPRDPRLRNKQPPWINKSPTSGNNSWNRPDGSFIADGRPQASNDMMSSTHSPHNQGQRYSQFAYDFSADSNFGTEQERERDNSGENRNSRERYHRSGNRDGDSYEPRRIAPQYDGRDNRERSHHRGRGGKRGQFRGGYRGGGPNHQDPRHPSNNRNQQGRGGDRGRPFYKPRGGRNSFKGGYKKNYESNNFND